MSMSLASQGGQFLKFVTQKYLLSINQNSHKGRIRHTFIPSLINNLK